MAILATISTAFENAISESLHFLLARRDEEWRHLHVPRKPLNRSAVS
jgi:hypothetical protein